MVPDLGPPNIRFEVTRGSPYEFPPKRQLFPQCRSVRPYILPEFPGVTSPRIFGGPPDFRIGKRWLVALLSSSHHPQLEISFPIYKPAFL